VEIVKRSNAVIGFKELPKRRIVECTFGWLIRKGSLIRDYEANVKHSELMIYISMARLMLARIAAGLLFRQALRAGILESI